MLELQDICYQVTEDSKEKGILKHVNLKIEDSFVAITGPNGGGKSTMRRLSQGLSSQLPGRYSLMERILQSCRLQRGPIKVSALLFSSLCVLKV